MKLASISTNNKIIIAHKEFGDYAILFNLLIGNQSL